MAKLIFFLHGVAERNSDYGEPLPKLIKDCLTEPHELLYVHKSFWGNFLGEREKIWTLIDRDFDNRKRQDVNFDGQQSLKYQEARRGLFSKFVGDVFSYLSKDTGHQIREKIYNDLKQALKTYSDASKIYFVSHSLGAVILWDILFSKHFESDDPALAIRAFLSERIFLQGIVTMGSPIIFINMTLGITPQDVENGLRAYARRANSIRWLNFIHASDLIAYPLNPLLKEVNTRLIKIEDIYITRHLESPEKIAKKIADVAKIDPVQFFVGSEEVKEAIRILPGIVGTPAAHASYFEDSMVARRIAAMIDQPNASEGIIRDVLRRTIDRLKRVPGMTEIKSELQKKISQRLDFTDEVLDQFKLKDGSGSIILTKNIIQVHHVTVADRNEVVQFFGYVGLIHGGGLCEAVEEIQLEFGVQ